MEQNTKQLIEILMQGLQDEMNSAYNYIALAGRHGDAALKQAFLNYASEELKHAKKLMQMLQELDAVTNAGAAARVSAGENSNLKHDLKICDDFYGDGKMKDAKACDLLTSWYIQEIILPTQVVEEIVFDPLDETQVDLSGNVNAKVPETTEAP